MIGEMPSLSHNSSLPFKEGQIYHRQRDLHDRYGGQRQSGIATCATHPFFIFLFTSPSGEEYGYQDERQSENVYILTGQGQSGDMQMKWGNKAILNHIEKERELHLFKKVNPGYYEYIGQFEYDSHDIIMGKDVKGNSRKIIQFILKKV